MPGAASISAMPMTSYSTMPAMPMAYSTWDAGSKGPRIWVVTGTTSTVKCCPRPGDFLSGDRSQKLPQPKAKLEPQRPHSIQPFLWDTAESWIWFDAFFCCIHGFGTKSKVRVSYHLKIEALLATCRNHFISLHPDIAVIFNPKKSEKPATAAPKVAWTTPRANGSRPARLCRPALSSRRTRRVTQRHRRATWCPTRPGAVMESSQGQGVKWPTAGYSILRM